MTEAASVPMVGLTAWQALIEIGGLKKGQKVFIQAAALVGEGEEVQAVVAMFAGVVLAVGLPGAALGGDEGAVNQDHLPALLDDLLEDMVQARGLCGEQSDRLVAPASRRTRRHRRS
ncbi:hypothetical protein [Streptomyces sp. NPDC088254]|uniref:hypothetical protein n=1 Tax=Streptomyces sp. NPDC088254 TaxID=3365847 RepID=UPI00381FFB77